MLAAPLHRPSKRPPPPGPEAGGDGDGEADRISALPDDLLHRVLVRLECSCEAARTSVLARRWRGLWTCLPEYSFDDRIDDPEEVEAALARVTRPALDRLRIKLELEEESALDCASALLRAAARLSPETVDINLFNPVDDEEEAVELPCFGRTTTLILDLNGVPLAPPPAGVFTRLERLELTTGSDIFAALLPGCPRLRVLRIRAYQELKELTVRSATLEELAVERVYVFSSMSQIDIDAPELKKSKLAVEMGGDFRLTFSAPKVQELVWNLASIGNVGLTELRLFNLHYSLKQGVRTLRLEIDYTWETEVTDRSFAEEVAWLGVTDFSVLELEIRKNGHAFGPLLLDLLKIRPAIQKLNVVIERGAIEEEDKEEEEELCTENCACRHPMNWKSEIICLPDLEDVVISYDFEVGDEEVDLLKLLFRCAPGLKNMRVRVHDKIYKKICSICKENPHVKCEVSCH